MLPSTSTLGALALVCSVPRAPATTEPAPPARARAWKERQTWPLVLQGHLSSLGFIPTGRHGGGTMGTELVHVRRPIFRLVQPLRLGYTSQRPLMQGPTLETGLAARWLAPFGLFGSIGLNVGGQYVFAATRTYSASDGRFEPSRDPGRAHARVGLGVEVGYEFASTTRVPLRLFVGWEQRVLAPFAARNDLPVMPEATVSFGLAVHLRKAKL